MRYSEYPHLSYLDKERNGPGALFLGDTERWNWRYAMIGTEINHDFDKALMSYFNETQRNLMKREPVEALDFLSSTIPSSVTDVVRRRMVEAQRRFDVGRILEVKENVIRVSFGR